LLPSDHGDMMGEHSRYNKGLPYKTSAGVPFIIRYPRAIKKGQIVKTAYSSPDFAPTILKLMGVGFKPKDFHGSDGSGEILYRSSITNRKQLRFMTGSDTVVWAAAVDRNYKLVLSDGPAYLFDLKEDPDEVYNFHGNKTYEVITKTLEVALLNAMQVYNFPLWNVLPKLKRENLV